MELFRTQATNTRKSVKFKLPCQQNISTNEPTTSQWLTIESLLSYTNGNVAILRGTLARSKTVVVKFGETSEIITEYQVATKLYDANLVGFIKFVCMFQCNDDFNQVLTQNYVTRPHICRGVGDSIGCIIMPYYPLGSLNQFPWKKHQIQEFKNVLKQVCFALCVAYDSLGFVHMDMHAGNVVLRATKKIKLDYAGHTSINVAGKKLAMIMDLQKYCLQDPVRFMVSLETLLHTACNSDASDIVFDFSPHPLRAWQNTHSAITAHALADMSQVIENIPLRFVRSEIPLVRW